ncbi:hypothetical protein [Kozakia baliensis]|uniref:hypothetical protein n=1 Tax=Kozakia baliensis TaxID=153496 RepID=UPI0011BFAF99|nr:hypothetical protein [Kozakia baliensis]
MRRKISSSTTVRFLLMNIPALALALAAVVRGFLFSARPSLPAKLLANTGRPPGSVAQVH